LAINKSYNYINSVEQGKIVPSLDVIEKISEVLGVAPSVLFSDDSSPKNIKTFWREQYVSDMTDQLFNRLKPILATEIRNSLT
ncbi:MAG: helix-turn-helix transcriptional regulator, partial [Treponema sp.]|nr:helix-turn-helix transcriptional regulator [Treponema sp.]